MKLTLSERFWKKVDKSAGPSGCWLWTAAKSGRGYGVFVTQNERMAHRISYSMATGMAPGKLDVCHRCDNPPCVNPAHLFVGTRQENMVDCVAKGRARYRVTARSGELHHNAKLTKSQVIAIREACARGATQASLAKRYGVSHGNISLIVSRKNWRSV